MVNILYNMPRFYLELEYVNLKEYTKIVLECRKLLFKLNRRIRLLKSYNNIQCVLVYCFVYYDLNKYDRCRIYIKNLLKVGIYVPRLKLQFFPLFQDRNYNGTS